MSPSSDDERLLKRIWQLLDARQAELRLSLAEVAILLLIHFEPKTEDGFVQLKYDEIGGRIDRASPVTVAKAVKNLVERGLLEEQGVQGKPHRFRIRYSDPPRQRVRKLRIRGQSS
jgi:predicted transcriptional regulator